MPTSAGALDIRALAIDPSNTAILYAGNGSGIFRSTDGGASWVSIENGTLIRNISSIVVDPLAPNTVRVGTFFTGIFLSTNGGSTWTTDNQGLPPPTSVNALANAPGSVVASTPTTGTYRRNLASGIWEALAGLPTFVPPSALGWVSAAPRAGAEPTPRQGDGGGAIAGLYVLGIASASDAWGLAGMLLPPAPSVAPKAEGVWSYLPSPVGVIASTCPPIKSIVGGFSPGTFYAGGACGVLMGTNNGQSVTAMNNGLPLALQVRALAVARGDADIFAGTEGGGVFRYTKSAAAAPVTVVEYYNQALDHYFITWVPAEQVNLDAGNTPTRWTRTGYTFKAYTVPQAGASPVCRYYIPPNLGDSHFFGRGTQECNATGQANPSFTLESPDFMQMFLPSAGTCPAGTTNVYRVFSNRPDANHRYMTDPAVRTQMVARGWLVEGDGPDAVVMCAPQ
jgi:hypothetical protein